MSAAVEVIRAPMGGAWACPLTESGEEFLRDFFAEEPSELAPLGGRAGYIVEPNEFEFLAERLRIAGIAWKVD